MRTRTLIGATLIALFLLVPTIAVPAAVPDYHPGMSPAELHQIMAQAKTRELEKRLSVLAPASVMDVSGYDVTYYNLNLRIDEVLQWVYGEVTMRAAAKVDGYTSPTLNLRDGMTVDSVKSGGQTVAWSHASNFLYVTLNTPVNTGEEFEITIWYQGHPETGGFQGFSFSSHAGNPVITTLSEPYLAQSWWPCKDTPSDKCDSADMIITANSAFYVVSNGVLRDSVDNGNGTTTYSWHEGYPITSYLIQVAISNYSRFVDWYHYSPTDSMPVRFYSYPDRLAGAEANWPVAVDQLEFFSSIWGQYPFVQEKYGMVHFNWGGAMEHQTVTSATWTDFGFDQYVVGHELAHHWWGDYITCQNWNHIWLNEGFASYAEALWAEHLGGTSGYRDYMTGMEYYSGGRIYIDDTTSVGNIFSSRVYDKGAWVLHMLRGIVGDSDMFTILRDYYNDPSFQYGTAVTADFENICETVSGKDLSEFFQDWIYGYYYPKYAVSFTSEPRVEDNFLNVYVHLRQTQTSTPQVFDMPVDLLFGGVGGTPVARVENNQRDQDYVFVMAQGPTAMVVDPYNWILDSHTQETYTMHLVTNALDSATEYVSYHDSLLIIGGTPPYIYQLISGSLPSGVTFDGSTGLLSGTPTVTGDFPLTFNVYDQGFIHNSQKSMTLSVADNPYLPGDFNHDGFRDANDLNLMIEYLFFGAADPVPLNLADVNGDCAADALDLNDLIDFLFFGGSPLLPGCIE